MWGERPPHPRGFGVQCQESRGEWGDVSPHIFLNFNKFNNKITGVFFCGGNALHTRGVLGRGAKRIVGDGGTVPPITFKPLV